MIAQRRAWVCAVGSTALLAGVVTARVMLAAPVQDASDGWQIPTDAAALESPTPPTDATMARGRDVYRSKCQRCHGRTGVGNGPDADRDHPPGNLTDVRRASRNPDGVMFYKIWNGRSRPRMPAFKADMSRDDVWAVVQYVKSLRGS